MKISLNGWEGFTAEDHLCGCHEPAADGTAFKHQRRGVKHGDFCDVEYFIEHANRILAEKLSTCEKAWYWEQMNCWTAYEVVPMAKPGPTHTARLVCVEKTND